MSSDLAYLRSPVPFTRLTARHLGEALRRGEAALRHMAEMGLPGGERNRLSRALRALSPIAEVGAYPTGAAARNEVLDHLGAVAELIQLAGVLTERLEKAVLDELAPAVGLKTGKGAQTNDYMSTAFLGVVLTGTGRRAAIPAWEGRRPDWRFDTGEIVVDLEVKRPESLQSTRRALKTAAAQLHVTGKPRVIALDLTDVTRAEDTTAAGAATVDALFGRVAEETTRLCLDSAGASEKFARVVGLLAWTRLIGFDDAADPAPRMSVLLHFARFPGGYRGLLRGRPLFDLERVIRSGFQAVSGGHPPIWSP